MARYVSPILFFVAGLALGSVLAPGPKVEPCQVCPDVVAPPAPEASPAAPIVPEPTHEVKS